MLYSKNGDLPELKEFMMAKEIKDKIYVLHSKDRAKNMQKLNKFMMAKESKDKNHVLHSKHTLAELKQLMMAKEINE